MNEVVLSALDGRNPIAFLAALGVLNAVADRAKGSREPRLAWKQMGTYRPVLTDCPGRAELMALLAEDVVSFREEPAVVELRRPSDPAHKTVDDLKMERARFADYLRVLLQRGSSRSIAMAAAFATDVATDQVNGNTKPTALHFTAGQQAFLSMVGELIENVTPNDLEEALFGPWHYVRPLPVLQWDNTSSRDYALRASDPSKDKKLGVPGADWLAFRGLSFIRVAPRGDRVITTGCRGEWKTGAFRWPIWTPPLARREISSLLTSRELLEADPKVARARGVDVILESSIRRSDQGGYGSFSPARVAPPLDRESIRRGRPKERER